VQKWEYRELNVAYSDENENTVKFASLSDNHYVLSNVLKDDLHAFLKELENSGWKLEIVHRQIKHARRTASSALSNNGFAMYINPCKYYFFC
jgi:hypothetical protein